MANVREIRITGGRVQLRALVMGLLDQLEGQAPGQDVEAEVAVRSNSDLDPSLLLNLNSTGCEPGDECMVEYEEVDADG